MPNLQLQVGVEFGGARGCLFGANVGHSKPHHSHAHNQDGTVGQITCLGPLRHVMRTRPSKQASATAREPRPSRGLCGFCRKLQTLHYCPLPLTPGRKLNIKQDEAGPSTGAVVTTLREAPALTPTPPTPPTSGSRSFPLVLRFLVRGLSVPCHCHPLKEQRQEKAQVQFFVLLVGFLHL